MRLEIARLVPPFLRVIELLACLEHFGLICSRYNTAKLDSVDDHRVALRIREITAPCNFPQRTTTADIVGDHHAGAPTMSRPEQRDRNLSGQPLVTMGGGALPLPLPMPAQPATLTATRVATKATSTFFIGIPLSFTPRDAPFVPRCTVGRPLKPMVHRLRRQWGTSKGTVSLGTQLPSRPVAMCLWAGGWQFDGK